MDRRKSLKAILIGSVSTGVVLEACNNDDAAKPADVAADKPVGGSTIDRYADELANEKKVLSYTLFSPEEMATITVLGDIIIPKDDVSGSASEAGVPAFIEFIVKDIPEHQVPMRGGLRWLDVQCLNRYNQPFTKCTPQQQIEMVDLIAYPAKAKPSMRQGVSFFNLMRNLTASGFYSSKIGIKDIGYMGNQPNQWNGVPDDVLKQYGVAYSEKELAECISFS
jgi:gluconate 2-dehydrogenase gamma chain